MDGDLDFKIATQAGLLFGDIAKLVGVSRQAAHRWVIGNGKVAEHKPFYRRAKALHGLLTELVAIGKLPRPDMDSRGKRQSVIDKIKTALESRVAAK